MVQGKRAEEWFVWCLGAALFAHVVAYFGIDYFDEMQFVWYALLAIIAAAAVPVPRTPSRQVVQAEDEDVDALSPECFAAAQ
jgi:hypothetical protein